MSIDGGGDKSWQSYAEFKNYKLLNWESNCGNFLKIINLNLNLLILIDRYHFICKVLVGQPVYNSVYRNNGIGGYEGKLMFLYANGLSSKFDKKKFNYNASFSLTKKETILSY